MADQRLHVIVRPMALSDIDRVLQIDRLSFPIAWSSRTYRHEVEHNDRATMLVVENADARGGNGAQPGIFSWLSRDQSAAEPGDLLAYSGLWQIADEAHISTIAVHPNWRGYRLGELLVWMMVRHAIDQEALRVTLEVRVSNTVAQNLYRKYGFVNAGLRRGYYRDNNEDAHIMAVEPLDAAYRRRLETYRNALATQLWVTVQGLPQCVAIERMDGDVTT